MSSGKQLHDRLDEIYGGDPAAFTKARDQLAKTLKDDGERELAAEVKKLKRPTQAAATINRLSLGHPAEIERVLDAGAELRRVQANLGAAKAGEKLKAASAEQREAIDGALETAAGELGASGATLDRVSETLHGTAADEALAEAVRTGRVEREGQAAGLGGALMPPPKRGAGAGQRKAAAGSKRDAQSARKRRAAESKLEKAEAKASAAAVEEQEAMDRLRAAEKELKAAQTVHDGAAKTLERARGAVKRARAELERA